MSRELRKLILLSCLLLPVCLPAQDNEIEAGVDISTNLDEDIWAGQQLTLDLDLKTTGFSFSNSYFNLPEVKGAFLMQTDTTTVKLTRKIDGVDWQIVRYPLALYPQKAGKLEIPPIDVRFTTSAGFGSEEKSFEFQTEPLELSIKQPPGAKPGGLVVTTRSFELDYDWQPDSVASKTGDAVTLTVRRRAGDISAMLLPPLPVFRTGGLASYPQTPEISDRTDRGNLTGIRKDSITWVVEEPGVYEIPGVRFQWWDPVSRDLKERIVPGLKLDILPSPEERADIVTSGEDGKNSISTWLKLTLFLTGLLAFTFWLRFSGRAKGQEINDEKSAFAELQTACQNNQASRAHSAMHNWIAHSSFTRNGRPGPATLTGFARQLMDENLAAELRKLQEALVSPESEWRGDSLLAALRSRRQQAIHHRQEEAVKHLAPLNP